MGCARTFRPLQKKKVFPILHVHFEFWDKYNKPKGAERIGGLILR